MSSLSSSSGVRGESLSLELARGVRVSSSESSSSVSS